MISSPSRGCNKMTPSQKAEHLASRASVIAAAGCPVERGYENAAVAVSRIIGGNTFSLESPAKIQTKIALSLQRANSLLLSNPGGLLSSTNTGTNISENFFPLLVLETTGNWDLVDFDNSPGLFNFFRGMAKNKFPCDLDTTSIALTVLPQDDGEKVDDILDQMCTYRNDQGIFQVYFDRSRPRTDPTVCLNILSLFATFHRLASPSLASTLEYVFNFLETRAYLPNGTRYYPSAEVFLYFVGRFIDRSNTHMPAAGIGEKWTPVLKERVTERVGITCSNPLALAMRILLCKRLSISAEGISTDLKCLLQSQRSDGGWAAGYLCGYPSTGVNIQNVGLTTSLAIQALELYPDARLREDQAIEL